MDSSFDYSFIHLFHNYLSSERYWAICQTYKLNKTKLVSAVKGAHIVVRELNVKRRDVSERCV